MIILHPGWTSEQEVPPQIQHSTTYTDPIPTNSPSKIWKFYLLITAHFLDHMTILFMLLQILESIPIKVIIN